MADNLPEPKSREESYLAKAAGMDVTIPEEPLSRLEQYLAAIAEGAGSESYVAGDGITITGDTISMDLAQTTGSSTTKAMSQDAVSAALESVEESRVPVITDYDGEVSEYVGSQRPYIVTDDKSNITIDDILDNNTDATEGAGTLVVETPDSTTANLYLTTVETDSSTGNSQLVWNEVGAAGDTIKTKTLTSEDYNYPLTGTKTSVCLGMLEDGLYNWRANMSSKVYAGRQTVGVAGSWAFVVTSELSNGGQKYIFTGMAGSSDSVGDNAMMLYVYSINDGSAVEYRHILSVEDMVSTIGPAVYTGSPITQRAAVEMVFADPGTNTKIKIGSGATVSAQSNNMAIGASANANGVGAMAIGNSSSSRVNGVALGVSAQAGNASGHTSAVAIGYGAQALNEGAIAIGRGSSSSSKGEMNIGSSDTSYGYNASNYRLLSGLYDGQSDHDATTLGQLNGRVKQNAGAPTTSTVGTVGQLLEDTTNGKLYQCTAIVAGTDPDPDTYTWAEVGGGGGGATINSQDWSGLWQ